MKFTEHRDYQINMINHYAPGLVSINQKPYHHSCIVTQHSIMPDWPVHNLDQLTTETLQQLLDYDPEVLILGTGETQVFPPAHIFGLCAQQGVSLEIMNNASACRTYNVLTTEDREVVMGLILNQHST